MVSWIIVLYVLVRELSSALIDFARTNLSSNLLYQYVVWATRVATQSLLSHCDDDMCMTGMMPV